MFLTLNEIKDQFEALKKTLEAVKTSQEQWNEMVRDAGKIVIFGSGSSYSLAKSLAAELVQMAEIPAYAVPAGDFIVQTETYEKMVKDALIITISRSGSTSEIIRGVKLAKTLGAGKCISYCAVVGSEISSISDLDIELPWCFDNSVCQTRTVSNLYAAGLLSVALYVGEEKVIKSLDAVPGFYEAYWQKYDPVFEQIARYEWNQAVVLADSTLAGIAEEGALAFKEICQYNSNFYHILDVRHGPMVMIEKKSLVILYMTRENRKLQKELLKDIRKKGALCVVFDCGDDWEGDDVLRIQIPDLEEKAGVLFMMYGIQMITYQKALLKRVNPDQPDGLDAWIKLA